MMQVQISSKKGVQMAPKRGKQGIIEPNRKMLTPIPWLTFLAEWRGYLAEMEARLRQVVMLILAWMVNHHSDATRKRIMRVELDLVVKMVGWGADRPRSEVETAISFKWSILTYPVNIRWPLLLTTRQTTTTIVVAHSSHRIQTLIVHRPRPTIRNKQGLAVRIESILAGFRCLHHSLCTSIEVMEMAPFRQMAIKRRIGRAKTILISVCSNPVKLVIWGMPQRMTKMREWAPRLRI